VADSSKSERKNGPGRPFPKGVSGNPGGMPKEIADVKRKLRALLPEATETLHKLLKHKDGKVRIMAVREVYDRTMGKPTQPISDPNGKPVGHDLTDALRKLAGE
jgi:hypothetical protein